MKRALFLFALSLVGLVGCGGVISPVPFPTPSALPGPAPTEGPLRGGVLATFELNDQTFKVWVQNPHTIQQLFDLQAGTGSANIPSGKILRGPGPADYNAPWSWHLDPQNVEMADMTTEVCDAEPSYVEQNLAEFVDVVGRYCPWSAKLVSLQDFR